MTEARPKTFLFLQGPHGPFFRRLGRMLRSTGAEVWRVGFNAGDAAFWMGDPGYLPYQGALADWPETLARMIRDLGITDIVLYGDIRPIHAEAVSQARAAGLRVHVFEEGYMRPYWVTYERDGSNGHSPLMDLSIAEMRGRLAEANTELPTPPAHWGDMRQHIFYGALYHWFVIFRNRAYPDFRTHRALSAAAEAALYTRRLLLMPLHGLQRRLATWRIRSSGRAYHLVLLQLEHDASFRAHSPFATMGEFLEVVIDGFAKGAPGHHHLVFKAHPLENGQSPTRRMIARLAEAKGLAGRVHYLRGGKLGPLLDHARSAVTVNSTAGQQVLWRGLPLKAFGRAVYSKPELVSEQPLPAFFAQPDRPNLEAYRDFRRFLLETTQVPGGFYSRRGRRQLMRLLVDMMLADAGPYDALRAPERRTRRFQMIG